MQITGSNEFKFKVYSRRWGHYDTYILTKIENGWHVRFKVHTGDCDPSGDPYLYRNFNQDHINYPSGLSMIMESLWDGANNENLTTQQIQEKLNEIAEWVSKCEKSRPSWIPYY